MKKCILLALLLSLAACNSTELQEKVDLLTSENQMLKQKTVQMAGDLQAANTKLTDTSATDQLTALETEVTDLREKVKEVEALEKKAAERDDLKTRVDTLSAQNRETKAAADRMTFLSNQVKGVKAVIETNMGDIHVEFFHDLAPLHCFNFIARAESGFYDKTQFHRVIPGFMIQGGDPNSRDMNFNDDGRGAPLVSIPHEFTSKHHGRGVLSMARRGDPRFGAGTQFFVMHGDAPQLNNQYTIFANVTEGMDVVDKIVRVKRNRADHPLEPVWINAIKVSR